MKKRICLFAALFLLFAAVSCTQKPGNTDGTTETAGGTNGARTEQITLFDGADDYRIVVPADATAVQTRLSAKLADAAKEVTGKMPQRVTDDAGKYPEQKKEILLGLTSRNASQAVAGKLESSEWRIAWVGEKLVLLASNDALLAVAVDALTDAWRIGDGKISAERTDRTVSGAESVTALMNGTRFTCPVIVDDCVGTDAREQISSAFESLRSDLGAGRITLALDSGKPETTGPEILIGVTDRTASRQEMNRLVAPSYRIASVEEKIVIVASDDGRLCSAVRAFCEMLRQAKKGTVKGDLCFGEVYTVTDNSGFDGKKWLATVPEFGAGDLVGGYHENALSCVMVYDGTAQSDYANYLEKLTAAGFVAERRETLGENRYSLYNGEKATVYVSYSAQSGRTRVYAEQSGTNRTPTIEQVTGAETPRLWQLEVDNKNAKLNGGMSYVIRGTNGEFFILDGGYETEVEADRIYTLLREHTPEGQTPVIAGWFLSHLHGDHYGALLAFAEKYATQVPVKAFYYHFSERSGDAAWLSEIKQSVDAAMGHWQNAVRYGALHTGMAFSVAGVQVDVLFTQEDLYPLVPEDLNESSTVIRVTAGGQRILFLADMGQLTAERMLADLPASELKCDIVQVAHHGYEGASLKFYQTVDAETVLWPMNIVGWQETGYAGIPQNVFAAWYDKQPTGAYPFGNAWLVSSERVKKILLSGFGTIGIELPYTPQGEKLGDFRTFFEQNKQVE